MRMAEIGNGNIDPEYNRKMLGSARPKFLPSTGLSYSSDSADTESIQVFYGYSQRHNNTDKGFISIGNGFFCSHLLPFGHLHAIARAAKHKFLSSVCQS